MLHKPSSTNPFFSTPRFAFAFDRIPVGATVLDYGCNDGTFGAELLRHKQVEFYGVDRSRDAIARAKVGNLRHMSGDALPFEDNKFDIVTMFDVIEHVANQDLVLSEIRRVLKRAGALIISAPRDGFFQFLDTGNLKFRFPTAHRWYYSFRHSEEAYRRRYVENPDGLVGDIAKEKMWHQHFSEQEMRGLLTRNYFDVEVVDGMGFFNELLTFVSTALHMPHLFPHRVWIADAYMFSSSMIFCAARRAE